MGDAIIKVKNASYARYEELLLRRDAVKKRAFQYGQEYTRTFGELILKVFEKKIECIRKKTGHIKPFIFSNDMEYVRDHFRIEDAVYISSEMFEHYQDWYDMFLMSRCGHNIIANSTFSWWSAWLNQNPGKIVIAPDKWINIFDYKDIYPEQWIKL